MKDQLLTISQVAGAFKVSETTIRRWVSKGVFEVVMPPDTPGRVFIHESELHKHGCYLPSLVEASYEEDTDITILKLRSELNESKKTKALDHALIASQREEIQRLTKAVSILRVKLNTMEGAREFIPTPTGGFMKVMLHFLGITYNPLK